MSEGRGLTVLVPIAQGRVEALRTQLGEMPTGALSPMARVPGTHFARWAIVAFDGKDGRPDPDVAPHLLFSSEFDGAPEAYVAGLCRELGATAHAVWSHCAGYPGDDDGALPEYLLRHRVSPGYSVVAYPGVTVEDVKAGLALRDSVTQFAMGAGALDPAALKQAWLEAFPQDPA
ncbi:MAG: hypothetical protein QOD53_926 [Thermoleophilaceae bacterium]|nr:hypothetical protein [Thermoleophilaceae bacterium]